MLLIADKRERKVLPYFNNLLERYDCDFEERQLTVGDYVVQDDDRVIAIFERKTWKDLAASIKDGRIHNVEKLLTARETSDTPIFLAYLIDANNVHLNPEGSTGRIKNRALLSHLDHLQFRDNIHVMYCKPNEGCAERIFEWIKSIYKIVQKEKKSGGNTEVLNSKLAPEVEIAIERENFLRKLGLGKIAPVLLEKFKTIENIFTIDNPHKFDDIATPAGYRITKPQKKILLGDIDEIKLLKAFREIKGVSAEKALYVSFVKFDRDNIPALRALKIGNKRITKLAEHIITVIFENA